MKLDDIYLAGVGSELPELLPTDLAVRYGWYDAHQQKSSGMQSVAVAGEIAAPDLAVRAARVALARAGHAADDFGAVLHSATYHQGPDGWSAPHYVLRRTLDRPISAVEIRQGCVGMLASLEIAAHRLSADRSAEAVLLTYGDNFSVPLVDRWRTSNLFLLADGGAAAVVSRRDGFARVLSLASVSVPAMEELHRGGEPLFPPGITAGRSLDFEDRMAYWRQQWALGVPPPMGHLGDFVAEVVEDALTEAGVPAEKVARYCHIGYSRGPLQAILLEPLGVQEQQTLWDLTRRTGHVGAGDPFIGLEHLWTTGLVAAGEHVVLIAVGPGMQASAAVLEVIAPFPAPTPREGQ